jgi:flavin-dependent dehydrogenase
VNTLAEEQTMTAPEQYDVIILGGGLAGLTLAMQLKQARPQTTIQVAEKHEHPVPEAAHKVGESTVEAGTYYLAEVLGLEKHLKTEQLPKLGLRYFFPEKDNRDVARRVEVGPQFFPPIPSYQLDRGRLENMLGRRIVELGCDFLDACKVDRVELRPDGHRVTFTRNGETQQSTGRWIVDATGRSSILKRQLELAEKSEIDHNAAWFRIGEEVAIDDWSDDRQWKARVSRRRRRFSTNHLMGPGYWVWLIPLASGSHSIGIVTDPVLHPFDQINTFERARAWLQRYEPQCAEQIEARRDKLQDFRVLKRYSFSCKQVYSAERWCLTGEAGVFLDPFYSVGTDMIGCSNSLVSDLIAHDLDGDPIEERAEAHNRNYLWRFRKGEQWYAQLMPIWGNAQVTTAKTVWDFATYWGVICLLDFRRKWPDFEFIASIQAELDQLKLLDGRVHDFFLEWDKHDHRMWRDGFAGHAALQFVRDLGDGLEANLDGEPLRAQIRANLRQCEAIAAEMFRRAAEPVSPVPDETPINPYAISLDPARWDADGLFTGDCLVAKDEAIAADLAQIWMDRIAQPSEG